MKSSDGIWQNERITRQLLLAALLAVLFLVNAKLAVARLVDII